jgi:zinc protease
MKPAPLRLIEKTLENGLRVVLVEDHRLPMAAVNVGYHVGGKDDPPGRSGFAHLFEHLMFKGTESGTETIDRLTEDVGGYNNAFTTDDLTDYHEVIPSNYLERIIWAEADRLRSLRVDEPNFETEREVVVSEYDQRILADPYGMLDVIVNRRAFTVHPYGRGVIGLPTDLYAADLSDVRLFHRTYYRPDNAVLVVAGDFEPTQLERWIDAYFGPLKPPAGPIPRVAAREPRQKSPQRERYVAANAPLGAVNVSFHICGVNDEDAFAFDVAETILAMGKSSRLYRSLVYEQRIASQVFCVADMREHGGLFQVQALLQPGTTAERAESAIGAELLKLASEPVGSEELDKVRAQILSALLRRRESCNDLAQSLVRAAILRGDPRAVDRDPAAYLAVSAADVTRVCATLRDEERITVEYVPAGAKA